MGVVSLVAPSGPESTIVWGGVVSIVIERLAGVGSVFWAVSIARTSKVCGPSGRDAGVWLVGLEQAPNAAPSSRHWKLEPASSELNPNVGVGSLMGPEGPESIAVTGATVSTVNERLAGVESTFWAGSVARTSKAWGPSDSAAGVWLVKPEQAAKAAASIRHWKVAPPSSEEKPKVGGGVVGGARGAGVD